MKKFLLFAMALFAIAFTSCDGSRNYVVETDLRLINTPFYRSNHSVVVTSDYNWDAASDSEWIKFTKGSGAAGVTKLEFYVEQNPTLEERRGTIEICAKGSKEIKALTIIQKANDFSFVVENITAKTVDLKVIPLSDSRTYYWYTLTDQDFSDYYERNTEAVMKGVHAMIKQYITMGVYPNWSAALSQGPDELSAKGLYSNTEYIFFAFGVDTQGNITSKDISYTWFKTLAE
jgi:hypothetical protein